MITFPFTFLFQLQCRALRAGDAGSWFKLRDRLSPPLHDKGLVKTIYGTALAR